VISGLRPNHARHAHIVRIVVFDLVLSARGIRHRRFEALGKLDDLVVGAHTTGACVNRDVRAFRQHCGDLIQILVTRPYDGLVDMDAKRGLGGRIRIRDVDRDNENCHPPLGDRGLTRHDCLSQRLVRRQDHFAKYAAAAIDVLEIHFLNKIESKLASHHLARDEDHRRAIAVRLIQPVDEMQAARSTAAGHGGQAVHQERFALCRIGTRLLMAHVHKLDITATQTGGKRVQRVAHDAVAILDTG
jgi:hypothetical protein